jgi:hypothetical protein
LSEKVTFFESWKASSWRLEKDILAVRFPVEMTELSCDIALHLYVLFNGATNSIPSWLKTISFGRSGTIHKEGKQRNLN